MQILSVLVHLAVYNVYQQTYRAERGDGGTGTYDDMN